MVKPRGEVSRHIGFSPAPAATYPVSSKGGWQVAAWAERPDLPPYQVHLELKILGLGERIIRFKSPDSIGFMAEELAHYRLLVWPQARPVGKIVPGRGRRGSRPGGIPVIYSPRSGRFFQLEEFNGFNILAWCRDLMAETPPVQVHLHFLLGGLSAPVVIRFESPKKLESFIDGLARHRQFVWPEAEPLDLSGKPADDPPARPSAYRKG